MRHPDPVEQALERLSALKHEAENPAAVAEELKTFLKNRSNLIVAKAAKVTCEKRAAGLVPDLAAAFHRFMKDPHKLDKGCAALTEIVAALYELDYLEPEIYLAGIHHVQMEGSFGPPVDAAAKLRGLSALGLARTRHPHALDRIVTLLVDAWPEARLGAVRSLATNGGEAGALLLKLKVLTGENEPDVLAECFAGLLAVAPETSLQLIANYVDSEDPAFADAALFALASSRSPAALDFFKEKWSATRTGPLRKALLLGIATFRSDAAIEFLLLQLRESSTQIAKEVIPALALFRDNERVTAEVEAIVSKRKDKGLEQVFREQFEEQ